MDPYQRNYIAYQPKMKPETLAIIGGSLALVAVVLIIKARKKKRKK